MDRLIVLVVLRWRLELRALSRGRERIVGLLLAIPGLLAFSGFGSLLVYFGVRSLEVARPEAVLPLISVAATGVGLFWVLSPLLAGVALTESHDMSRLLHFPIPLPTLVASSFLANLAQPAALAEVPILVALALGVSSGPALPFALGGVLLSFFFILAAAQVAGLVLHGASRNRRLQDLALVAGMGLGFLLSAAPLLLIVGGGRSIGAAARFLTGTDLFVMSPFAWGVRAAVHAGRGEIAACLSYGVLGVLGVAGAMGTSAALIHRIHRGEMDLGGAPRGAAARGRMLLGGELGALLEKDVRSGWRDPALKASLLLGLLGPVLLLFFLSRSPASSQSGTAILILASFVGLSSFGANAFGLERRGVALLMGFPVPRWKILVSKNLAAVLFRLPGLLTLLLAALLLAPPALLPAAAAIVASTLLIASGLDNYMSILFPVAVPAAGQNPYGGGAAGGRGLAAAALGVLLMAGALLLSAPFTFLAWLPLLLGEPWLWLGSLPLAVAGAAAVYAMLVAGSAALLSKREPELLERILVEE